MADSLDEFRSLVSPLAGGSRHELEVCRALLSGEVLPTDDWQLVGDEFTDETLRRRRELEGHLRSARPLVPSFLYAVRGYAEWLDRRVADEEADKENEREVEYRLRLADERIKAAKLAACGSGWDDAVVAFVVDRINAVHDGWTGRWQSDDGEVVPYPTLADFVVEVGRWCDAYADMLEALQPLLIEARKRMVSSLDDERKRADEAKARIDEVVALNSQIEAQVHIRLAEAFERGRRAKQSEMMAAAARRKARTNKAT